MTTHIVRDVTLVVNGAPESRANAPDHLQERQEEMRRLDPATVAEYLGVLSPVSGEGTDTDPEVLLALTLLGIVHPEVAADCGVSAVASGRRLAARLEQAGDPESALAVTRMLREAAPDHATLARDEEAITRRMGMVHDLADRYFRRAELLQQRGKHEEAVGWLREVLLLDGSRTDAARMIRDMRLAETIGTKGGARWNWSIVLAILAPLVVFALVRREQRLRTEFEALPAGVSGNLDSQLDRLDAVETFLERHHVWHGTLALLSERSQLRAEVDRLAEIERQKEEELARHLEDRATDADLLCGRAAMRVEGGDFQGAIDDYRKALETAPEGWSQRERVERDIAAIEEHLAGSASTTSETEPNR